MDSENKMFLERIEKKLEQVISLLNLPRELPTTEPEETVAEPIEPNTDETVEEEPE